MTFTNLPEVELEKLRTRIARLSELSDLYVDMMTTPRPGARSIEEAPMHHLHGDAMKAADFVSALELAIQRYEWTIDALETEIDANKKMNDTTPTSQDETTSEVVESDPMS